MKEVLNQLVNFGFLQSVFLLLIFLVPAKKEKNINSYMLILIMITLMGLIGKIVYNSGIYGSNFRFIAFSEFSALLFGPTIYLFTESILHKTKYTHSNLFHYVPGVAYSLFIVVYFIIPSDAIILSRIKTGELQRVIYACHAVGLLVNITYWFKGFKVFVNFEKEMKKEASFEVHIHFMRNFLFLTGFCLLVWTVLFVTSFFGFPMLERNARPYIWILLTLIILFITYYLMLQPQVLRSIPEIKSKKYHQSKLSIEDMEILKVKLDKLMLEKKPYLNNKLLKKELAELLGINGPELARLLNENVGMNFFEYINYFRIKEFVNLAKTEKGKQLTFYGLAQEAGFNSKTTFNKSFKKLMGVSPSVYFNQKI
ncbi:MAG: AraC family transcriptional regulator [Tenacibaculum sp.]|uniref:helix-turn-helix domain-containing protein n=1 Tax=Tenacibaculum sp. TaxID=1906242 RepID=UPI00179134FE|nr:helix-turn-helix domain-containing protein [Tenacibaculum sp.]NVK10265.1 AraC family transcriptional regulator [Tenacibaculum sp.]